MPVCEWYVGDKGVGVGATVDALRPQTLPPAAAARKIGGKKGKKLKKVKLQDKDVTLNHAKLNMSITKGKKLKKAKLQDADVTLGHAKLNMSIAKGTKLKKAKLKDADVTLDHAKLNMSIAKGTKLKKSKAEAKPAIPAWVKEEMTADKAECGDAE